LFACGVIAQQRGRLVQIYDQNIHVSIVIKISESTSTSTKSAWNGLPEGAGLATAVGRAPCPNSRSPIIEMAELVDSAMKFRRVKVIPKPILHRPAGLQLLQNRYRGRDPPFFSEYTRIQ
jgi:hypothetical protein